MTMKFGFGQPLTRKEDDPLLRGAGRYIADVTPASRFTQSWCAHRTPMRDSEFTVSRKYGRCRASGWC